jgi:UPF0755 protein
VIVVLVAVIGSGWWTSGRIRGAGGAPVDVIVPEGTSTAGIAQLLGHDGVVKDAWLFRWYLRLKGGSFEAGEYQFRHDEGFAAALRQLRRGPTIPYARVTIPEGFTLGQIAARVGRLPHRSAQRFLSLASSGAIQSTAVAAPSGNLEGLLFPDTYLISPTEDENAILRRMVNEFDETVTALGISRPALANGLTPYQTVIVASMVEREAKVPEDRGKIARVIVNRLQRGMKLQIDATVLYALGVQTTAITAHDLAVASPYNTYVVPGLPPGPIASPGRASLEAALNPTPGPWLYYVLADSAGHHAFASTPQEFDRLRAQAQAKGLLG